jgi:hypothetical protein
LKLPKTVFSPKTRNAISGIPKLEIAMDDNNNNFPLLSVQKQKKVTAKQRLLTRRRLLRLHYRYDCTRAFTTISFNCDLYFYHYLNWTNNDNFNYYYRVKNYYFYNDDYYYFYFFSSYSYTANTTTLRVKA